MTQFGDLPAAILNWRPGQISPPQTTKARDISRLKESRNNNIRIERDKLKDDLEEQRQVCKALSHQLDKSESQVKTLKQQLGNSESRIDMLEQQRGGSESQIIALKQQLNHAERSCKIAESMCRKPRRHALQT
jgi:septal ring factor EnvC (AmiA/AmiB activator)